VGGATDEEGTGRAGGMPEVSEEEVGRGDGGCDDSAGRGKKRILGGIDGDASVR
jgi:hypothetical protein